MMDLQGAAVLTRGTAVGGNVVFESVSTDSRALQSGQLFVALRGERFDAHDFLDQAVAQGAVALVVSDPARVPAGVPALVVADTRRALRRSVRAGLSARR